MFRRSWVFKEFVRRAEKCESSFAKLEQQERKRFGRNLEDKNREGIYVLYGGAKLLSEGSKPVYVGGKPVYVGRTRNLQQRFRSHTAASYKSTSSALQRVRDKHGLKKTKKGEGSRAWMTTTEPYRSEFIKEIGQTKTRFPFIDEMTFQFIEESDQIDQYFLELYVTWSLKLPLYGFYTH